MGQVAKTIIAMEMESAPAVKVSMDRNVTRVLKETKNSHTVKV